MRQGLRATLESQPDFSVIGEASDGLETLQVVEQLRPNVLVLDLLMPGLNGFETLRRVAEYFPKTCVVVLSIEGNEKNIAKALSNGALGYVVKDAPTDELFQAIREAAAGKRHLSPRVFEIALSAYVKRRQSHEPDPDKSLTDREREVLHLAAQGLTNREIGTRLFISPRTVESHRASMMRKLGLRKPADLILYAVRHGILSADKIADEVESQANQRGQPKGKKIR